MPSVNTSTEKPLKYPDILRNSNGWDWTKHTVASPVPWPPLPVKVPHRSSSLRQVPSNPTPHSLYSQSSEWQLLAPFSPLSPASNPFLTFLQWPPTVPRKMIAVLGQHNGVFPNQSKCHLPQFKHCKSCVRAL
jgi:hypothetical protein